MWFGCSGMEASARICCWFSRFQYGVSSAMTLMIIGERKMAGTINLLVQAMLFIVRDALGPKLPKSDSTDRAINQSIE